MKIPANILELVKAKITNLDVYVSFGTWIFMPVSYLSIICNNNTLTSTDIEKVRDPNYCPNIILRHSSITINKREYILPSAVITITYLNLSQQRKRINWNITSRPRSTKITLSEQRKTYKLLRYMYLIHVHVPAVIRLTLFDTTCVSIN